ncbi:YibE/F family protein [Clostridium manihotivorum]|uniref:YibE/F family protein n=1 Tax=Clostridium manihotivorum TaxID=2320868 RepID=A0A3R5QXB1_9CLOT|nr:YibE/F family protein [Clostridium manihotivorum]QAA34480.1 YibE/F family protein [Clostridium manihotivorum]
MLKSSKLSKIAIWFVIFSLFAIFLYKFNSNHPVGFNTQGKTSYVKYEKAEVLTIKKEALTNFQNSSTIKLGSQDITVKILSGEHKGETKDISNYLSDTHSVYVKKGMTIIVEIDTAGTQNQVLVYNYYRAPIQYLFILIFIAALCIIGRSKGFKSVVGLAFTFVCVIFLFIPMLYRGYSPVMSAILIITIVTCITLFLLNGYSSKTLSAVLGTLAGVIIAGFIALIVGNLAHLNGFNTQDVETLNMISAKFNMKVEGLLLSGILIAALGAVMDLSISIASSIQEVYISNPKISKKELFNSGMNIGRDMMGTMANTLILAFTGSSLNMLIIIYFYNVSYNQLINMDMVNVEIIQGLTGSLAVILIVPIVSFISSALIPAFAADKKKANSYKGKTKKAAKATLF